MTAWTNPKNTQDPINQLKGTTMTTQHAILDTHGVTIPAHLTAQAEVPVLASMQRQGDVLVRPVRAGADQGAPIPAEGIPVVRGEAGGNTHLLVGDGFWRPVGASRGLILGTLTVPDDAEVFLLHPEHGATGIAPGCYLVSRQREQADEIRMVAD